ncbi:MAG: AsmA-like C-terminal region-containing protein, partial [Verrucomicrobiota bacterium]|nr:AsmA-like C-terminal region-containing protein [Verrucomicrobiota bacterium]
GIILRFDGIHLRSDASVEFEGVELRATNIDQSLFRADAAELKLKWQGLNEMPSVESLILSKGTLLTPSAYSDDGYHRPILEHVAFRLVPSNDNWKVDRFVAFHESIRLQGSFDLPSFKKDSTEASNIDMAIDTFYKHVAKLSQQKERINCFLTPTVAFKSSHLDANTTQIELSITSQAMQHAKANAEKIQLLGVAQFMKGKLVPMSEIRLTAEYLNVPGFDLAVEDLKVQLPFEDLTSILSGEWTRLNLAAKQLNLQSLELFNPALRIDSKAYPLISFQGASNSLEGAIDLNGQFNALKWSGRVHALGCLDLVKLIPEEFTEKIPKIAYETPPYYELKLDFEEGFNLKHTDLKAQFKALRINELTFDHVNAHASYANGLFVIKDLNLHRQQQWFDLTFSLDTTNSDYHGSLVGSAVPHDYNSILPSWWAAVFENVDFSHSDYNLSDFTIHGNTQQRSPDLYYGYTEASKVSYKGVVLDEAELIVRGRGSYCELRNLNVRTAQDWARGNIAFASKHDDVKSPASIRLDMEVQFPLAEAAKLFKSDIAKVITDFKTSSTPLIQLEAAIFNKAYSEYVDKSYVDLSANLDHPLNYKDVPLDNLSFKLFGRSQATHLREVKLGYANGIATAMIDIFMPLEAENSLVYAFDLKDADQKKALRNLPQFDHIEDNPEGRKTNKPTREDARIDLNLRGQGPTEDFFKHKGLGYFEIRNDKLGTIQLLGPLSKILQNTQLSFTSFNLSNMHGDFQYKDNLVTFDPLRINGDRTQIDTPGTLCLSNQTLDMNVEVKLFGNAGKPDSKLRKIGELITKPIPNLLQFELTGTLKDQKLRSLYDPRNLIPRL